MSTLRNFIRNMLFFKARKALYASMFLLDKVLILTNKNKIVILCYHSISKDRWRFAVPFDVLKAQIEYLRKHYDFISLDDVYKYINRQKKIERKSVVITFDDGYKDVYETKDYFKKLGIRPILFVLADSQKPNRKELDNMKPLLSKKEVLTLQKSGWEIGSHSATHANLLHISQKDIDYEIVQSKKKLEKELNCKINYFAYPKGYFSLPAQRAVKKAGFKMGLSLVDELITLSTNPLLVPRVGVDGTHSFIEFKAAFLTSGIYMRKILRKVTQNAI